MAQTTNTSATASSGHQAETTFKNYNSKDAANYAAYRSPYPPLLISMVMDKHISTGGQSVRVLDLGCGPGQATRQIAVSFEHVIGVDASPSMIDAARQTPCVSSTGEQARFEVCGAEDFDKVTGPESIDLITVAMAAHWFDMPNFYAAASKVLKPSGTIAIWTAGSVFVDPQTTPNAAAVQDLWSKMEHEVLRPFMNEGNILVRDLYANLPLPWTIPADSITPDVQRLLATFDRQTFFRREFNPDGKPDPAPEFVATHGFLRFDRTTFDMAAKQLGTASPVTRWRAHYKEQLEKGEIEDCVQQMVGRTKQVMEEVEEGKGRTWTDLGSSMVLLMIKKKS